VAVIGIGDHSVRDGEILRHPVCALLGITTVHFGGVGGPMPCLHSFSQADFV
jgi:hypothetical protein